MNKLLLVIVFLAVGLILFSVALSNFSSIMETKIELDHELAMQPDSPMDILEQNRMSIYHVNPKRDDSGLMFGMTLFFMAVFGIPIALYALSGRWSDVMKQWRLLSKKKSQSQPRRLPYIQELPSQSKQPSLLEGGQSWLDS